MTALLLLGATVLCGLRLPLQGDRTLAFEAFGFVEGVLALLVLYLFLRQGVLRQPEWWFERFVLLYWLCATAVVMRLALPPPGLGYWIGVAVFSAVLLGAFGGGDRRRSVFVLGIAVGICGLLRFAVIPFIWRHATLPDLGPLEFSGISDWAKGLVTEYQPVQPGNEILNVAGLTLYALAIWREWPSHARDALEGLSAEEREGLLALLIASRLERQRGVLTAPSQSRPAELPAPPGDPRGAGEPPLPPS